MSLVDDDYVIEKISAATSDPTLRHSVLPWARGTDAPGLHAARHQEISHLLAELAVTIEYRVAVRAGFRECFSQLLHYPLAGRMVRDIQMEDPSTTMLNHAIYSTYA